MFVNLTHGQLLLTAISYYFLNDNSSSSSSSYSSALQVDPFYFRMPARISTGSWHDGETQMHQALKVPAWQVYPTADGLPYSFGMRVVQSPMMAVGTTDSEGRIWTTIWGGNRGFSQPIAENILGLRSRVDTQFDPVARALLADRTQGTMQINEGRGKVMAGLAIDLETRDRVKLMGKVIALAEEEPAQSLMQMGVHIEQSLGNCPKYLNKKEIFPNEDMKPELMERTGTEKGLPLGKAALDLISKADLFFLSSEYDHKMDTNIRGGSPGFMRVVRNDEGGVELIYPEFSGNRMYQTLGNLKMDPRVGIAIPDLITGNILYLTGSTNILINEDASSLLPRTKLAVKISIAEAILVSSGLPVKARVIDYSPYNPPVRLLNSEHDAHSTTADGTPAFSAQLVKKEAISNTVQRFTLRLTSERGPLPTWFPGQYATFDFGEELDNGYSHMRDSDPQSLNDDYVRTFTVSSVPPAPAVLSRTTSSQLPSDGVQYGEQEKTQLRDGVTDEQQGNSVEIELTLRRNGPVTGFLWSNRAKPGQLQVPVLGFGGEEKYRMKERTGAVFIAAGVGITPLLAQAPGLLKEETSLGDRREGQEGKGHFKVFWSLKAEDLAFASDTLGRIPGLAERMTIFVTGKEGDEYDQRLETLRKSGVNVKSGRRMQKEDVDELMGEGRSFYLCTGPALLTILKQWLEGEVVEWEDFGY